MGTRGPVSKREDQRRRRNEPEQPLDKPEAEAPEEEDIPAANSKWHPIAKRWYNSLAKSVQSDYYEESDWATAYLIAESISRDLKPQFVGVDGDNNPIIKAIPIKGASLSAYLKAMTALLATEGDRRRAGIELQRPNAAPTPSDVPNIDDYRARAAAAG